jgi:hypothetical protein
MLPYPVTVLPLMSGQFFLMSSHQVSSSLAAGAAAVADSLDPLLVDAELLAAAELDDDAEVAADDDELDPESLLDPHAVASRATAVIPATILILFLAGLMSTRPTSVSRLSSEGA